MFMGRENNNNNGVNVNTKLFTSYSDTAMITLSAWNQQISVKVHPSKGLDSEGLRQYATDNTEVISTSLTLENATTLLDGVKEKLKPALDTKGESKVSVSMGNADNRKVLSLGVEGEDTYFELAINVDENGKAEEKNIIKHVFRKKMYMEGYDPKTGEGVMVTCNADFENFIIKIEDVYKLSPAIAHGINYSNAVKQSFRNNRSYNSNNNNNGGNSDSSYSAPVMNMSADAMNDFLPFN